MASRPLLESPEELRAPATPRRGRPHGRPPSLVERSEAWQVYREEKLEVLRKKCQAAIGTSASLEAFKKR